MNKVPASKYVVFFAKTKYYSIYSTKILVLSYYIENSSLQLKNSVS